MSRFIVCQAALRMSFIQQYIRAHIDRHFSNAAVKGLSGYCIVRYSRELDSHQVSLT